MKKLYLSLIVCLLTTSGVLTAQEPTFYENIAPIIFKKCTPCHQKDKIGPMPLTSYDEVSSYGAMIKYVTSVKYMPPWLADPEYRHFKNERVLTNSEIEAIADWVDTGMKKGKDTLYYKVQAPKVTDLSNDSVYAISMNKKFEQYGVYHDQYQVFSIEIENDTPLFIKGIRFRPGNKEIVRSISFSIESADKERELDKWDPRYGYYSFGGLGFNPTIPLMENWSVGQETTIQYKKSMYIPAHSSAILHIHYGPTGKPAYDSTSIDLIIDEKPYEAALIHSSPLLSNATLKIDTFIIKKDKKSRIHNSLMLPTDIELNSVTPRANLLASSWEVFAVLPDKSVVKLLKIPEWNFMWKETYRYEKPQYLPEGTIIHCITTYDNTQNNPFNPASPPIDMSWGKQMFKENQIVYFQFSYPDIHGSTAYANGKSARFLPSYPTGSKDSVNVQINILNSGVYSLLIEQDEEEIILFRNKFLNEGILSETFKGLKLSSGVAMLKIRRSETKNVSSKILIILESESL